MKSGDPSTDGKVFRDPPLKHFLSSGSEKLLEDSSNNKHPRQLDPIVFPYLIYYVKKFRENELGVLWDTSCP